MDSFLSIRQVYAFVSRRPLAFGDLEQIEAVRVIECAESLLGTRIECPKCEGAAACWECDAACSACRGIGSFVVSRERLDGFTIGQLRRLSARAAA